MPEFNDTWAIRRPPVLANLGFDIDRENWMRAGEDRKEASAEGVAHAEGVEAEGISGDRSQWRGATDPGLGDLWKEHVVAKLVARLRAGEVVETKAFLRPIFKWCKKGAGEGYRNIEKAFVYTEWLVKLSRQGDESLGLAPQTHLNPSYAFNTIITACQRGRAERHAKRAYVTMLRHGYRPDVFTHTALIDILGRTGDLEGAFRVYRFMRDSPPLKSPHPGHVRRGRGMGRGR
ncbi:unnamed protein product, partial [Discosporangium mesarthrocarpum]